MGDFTDRQKLLALPDVDQTCESCDAVVPVADCDVVDGEVVCIDCMATYYPATYARRTGDE